MRLLLATKNSDKLKEIEDILSDLGLDLLSLLDFSGYPAVVEDGKSLEENAVKKARAASAAFHMLSLAEDSGLEVESLGAAPGVFSSRFAGDKASYEENNRKLLRLLEGVPPEERAAIFRTVVAISEPTGEIISFEGACSGSISLEPRGDSGFGYDPVFFIPETGMTFAELGRERKNQISHRAKALAKVKEYLRERL